MGTHKDPTEKLMEQMNHKIDYKKLVGFLYEDIELEEEEIKKANLCTITSKSVKCLGVNLKRR